MEHRIINKNTVFWIYLIVFASCKISYLTFKVMPIRLFYLFVECLVIFGGSVHLLKNGRIKKYDAWILAFIIFEYFTTLYNKGDIVDLIRNTESVLLLYISARWALDLEPKLYISTSAKYFTALTIFNTITELICYPNALFYYGPGRTSGAFLLGGDNTSTRLYILCIMFSFLYSKISNKKWIGIFSLINFIIFSFVRDIGNGKVCSLVMLAFFIIFEVFKIDVPNNPARKTAIIHGILFLLLVVFNKIGLFSYFIITFLHRDLTLTTRTTIWSVAIDKIITSPIIGNGYYSSEHFESLLPHLMGVNAHNTFLVVLFIGGAILGGLFIVILIKTCSLYDSTEHDKALWIIPSSLFTMMLRAQIEGGDLGYFFMLFVILFYVDRIEKLLTDEEKISVGRKIRFRL